MRQRLGSVVAPHDAQSVDIRVSSKPKACGYGRLLPQRGVEIRVEFSQGVFAAAKQELKKVKMSRTVGKQDLKPIDKQQAMWLLQTTYRKYMEVNNKIL